MSKTKTPFLSLGATGTVADTLTASKLGNVTVLKKIPTPTDRRTLLQFYQRIDHKHYAFTWRLLSSAQQASYESAARPYHLTGYQLFMREQLLALTNLSARWHLDALSGTLLRDSSKNSNTLTRFGALTGRTGQIDKALYFDGIDDYARCPNSTSLNPTHITLECWFNCVSLPHGVYKPLIQKPFTTYNPPYYQYTLLIRDKDAPFTDKVLYLWISVSGAQQICAKSTLPWDYNQWHHVAGTYDGETMRLYLDGEEVNTNVTPSGDIDSYDTPLELAACPTQPKNDWFCFNGLIDEARIYSLALPAELIKIHSGWSY